MKKKIIIIGVIILVLIITINWITFPKKPKEYKAYSIGQQVKVKVNNELVKKFYVLKDTTKDEEFVTLFAPKNIGESRFCKRASDGNDYNNSLIRKELNELTRVWTNVKEKRLITIDELLGTGEAKVVQGCGGNVASCLAVSLDSWLIHKDETYWTMTKYEDYSLSNNSELENNRFVYIVDDGGEVNAFISGKVDKLESELDNEKADNTGIRPVIVISKEYVY